MTPRALAVCSTELQWGLRLSTEEGSGKYRPEVSAYLSLQWGLRLSTEEGRGRW